MSMARMFTLQCDGEGCGEGDDYYGPWSSHVRDLARQDGWRIGTRDYCPLCVEAMSKGEPR